MPAGDAKEAAVAEVIAMTNPQGEDETGTSTTHEAATVPPSQPGWTPWIQPTAGQSDQAEVARRRISVIDREWMKFEGKFAGRSKRTHKVGLADIPFPPPAAIEALKRDFDGTQFKKMALRWHPDKFEQRWGGRLHEDERDAIAVRVQATFEQVQRASARAT